MGLAATPGDPAVEAGQTGKLRRLKKITDRVAFRVPVSVAACIGVYYLIPVDRHAIHLNSAGRVTAFFTGLIVLATLIARQIRFHLVADSNKTRMESLALLLGLAIDFFAVTYLRMANEVEGLHTKTDSLYFTISTVATVGYGDIHATGQAARGVAIAQMLFDLVFIAAVASLASATVGTRLTEQHNKRGKDG